MPYDFNLAERQPDPDAPQAEAPRAESEPRYRRIKPDALPEYMELVARRVLGSPIEHESTREELRFGRNRGSLAVMLDGPKAGTFYDHETAEAGGVVQLLKLKGGIEFEDVFAWLRDNIGVVVEGWEKFKRVCDYVYRDESGNPLSRKVRWETETEKGRGKSFSWERWDETLQKFVGGKGTMRNVRRVVYRLNDIYTAPPGALVAFPEGEKDVDNAVARLGLLATCNPDGGSKTQSGKPGKWRPEYGDQLKGRNLIVIPDNDEVGASHSRTVATELTRAGCRVAIVKLPRGKDLTEWLDAGGTREKFDALVAASTLFVPEEPKAEAPREDTKPREEWRARPRDVEGDESGAVSPRGLPVIEYAGGKLAAATDRAEALLAASDHELFQRGDFLVRVARDEEIETADNEIVRGARLVRVDSMHLQYRMNRVIEFMKWNAKEKGYKPINPPPDVAMALLQAVGMRPSIPHISGIATAPLWRADGSILTEPGFDKESGMLYVPPPGITFPAIPENPTKDDARKALDVLVDLFSEFPFTLEDGNPAGNNSSPSRSVALSTVLTPLVRHALPTSPIHAFNATAAGSGKSKAARIASTIARGHAAAVVPGGSDISPEEFEKKISASLIAGDVMIVVDNVEGKLSSELLCSAATEILLNIRVLGISKHAKIPNRSVFIVNGNFLTIVGDLVRRTIRCSIDPAVDRPELRTFKKPDPVKRVEKDRGKYVAAALTVLRAFHVAGRPQSGLTPLGSFEEWSKLVRAALVWLGEADPCESMEQMRQQDPRRKALADVAYQWEWHVGIGCAVTAKEVIAKANEREERKSPTDFNTQPLLYPELREALLAVAADRRGELDAVRLGQWLNRNSMRFVEGLRFEKTETLNRSGSVYWRVVKVEKS